MSRVTELASGQINNGHDIITVGFVEAEELPAVVIVTWPVKATVLHPRRFSEAAAMVARLFATASTELARINARKRR